MGDKLRSNSSFRAWGIYDEGHEYSECLEVVTSLDLAERRVAKYKRQGSDRIGHVYFTHRPTTLLVHDGAHAVFAAMYRGSTDGK